MHVAYERKYSDGGVDDYTVHYRKRDAEGNWEAIELLGQGSYGGYQNPTTPAIYIDYYGDATVVWRYSYNFVSVVGGIVLRYKDSSWQNWSTYYLVPGTDIYDHSPTITRGSVGSDPNTTRIAWRDSQIDEIKFISGDYNSGQWQWDSSTDLSGGLWNLNSHARPSIHADPGSYPNNIYLTWQGRQNIISSEKVLESGCSSPSKNTPVICFREKTNGGWQPVTIFQVCNTDDRNPVITSFIDDENDLDALIAYQSNDSEISRLWRWSGSWTPSTVVANGGGHPAITTLDELYPQLVYTEDDAAPYRVQITQDIIPEMKESSAGDIPHSRLVTLQLERAFANIGVSGDLAIEIGDPMLVDDTGNRQRIQPHYRGSQLTPENAFRFKAMNVTAKDLSLQLPLRISGQRLSYAPGKKGALQSILGLRIKNGQGNRVLKQLRTYLSNIFSTDSTFVISDTLAVNLNEFRGKSIFIEGSIFFGNEQHHAQAAEVYDLRNQNNNKHSSPATEATLQTILPDRYTLGHNFPDPFNPVTTITYDLPSESQVKIQVFDIQGKLVTTLVNQKMTAGRHHVRWQAIDDSGNKMASGVYLYRMTAGNFIDTRKMVLLR